MLAVPNGGSLQDSAEAGLAQGRWVAGPKKPFIDLFPNYFFRGTGRVL